MKNLKICIDAGHGGSDPGAVKGDRYEKDDTLKIALRIGKVLEANEFEVFYTRKTDIYDSPNQKAVKGNESEADYFISIHRNASANTEANGVESYIYEMEGNKYEIAKEITNRIAGRGFKNRGVKVNKELTVIYKTKMPAMLLEIGFISNDSDNKLLDEKFYSICNDVCRGICKVHGIPFSTLTEISEGK